MAGRYQSEVRYGGPRGRYEFRVWGDDLAVYFGRLCEAGNLEDIEKSSESYIVSGMQSPFNAKLRVGRLDVKELVGTYKRLELWRPYLKARFPLGRQTIEQDVRPILNLGRQGTLRSSYPVDSFIDEIVDPCPHLALVPLAKTRYRFTVESCLAEFTDVTVGEVNLETAAVESEDVAAVLSAIVRLGLRTRENRSYQRALRSMLGIDGISRANLLA